MWDAPSKYTLNLIAGYFNFQILLMQVKREVNWIFKILWKVWTAIRFSSQVIAYFMKTCFGNSAFKNTKEASPIAGLIQYVFQLHADLHN